MRGRVELSANLGCIHGRLELKYGNPTKYITNDGEKVPLTPTMILEWVRAIVSSFLIFSVAILQYLSSESMI